MDASKLAAGKPAILPAGKPLQPLEEYAKAEWVSFADSPHFDAERLAILEAKPLALIFEDREPWLKAISQTLESLGAGGSVLDVGCGLGQQYEAMREWAPTLAYSGCDAVDRCLAICRRRQPDVPWLAVTYPDLPEMESSSYDVTLLRSILRYYLPAHGLRLARAAWRVARKAMLIGTWFPLAAGEEPEAESDGRGGYFVRWPRWAWRSVLEMPGVHSLASIAAPDSKWPARKLVVLQRSRARGETRANLAGPGAPALEKKGSA